MNRTVLCYCLLSIAFLSGCQTSSAVDVGRLYDGFDAYHYPITTGSQDAQRYFDQGLQFAYGFNHDEAIRSYRAAAQLDLNAPMPWWGIAHAHGMNINDQVMTDERWQAATEAAQQATARLAHATPKEAAMIRAISARYSWPPPAEQRTLDQAYADAMQQVWREYPNDPDVAVLYAESLMNLQPWDYWTNTGAPKGRAIEIVQVLESVLASQPDHPGATHFYIHAVEASEDPDRAIAAADRLRERVPGSGHLVHMPSHIYVRVGQYDKASDCNVDAVAADRRYLKNAPEPDLYWLYYGHNLHFLAYASMMEGCYEKAIVAARDLEREIPEHALRKYAGLIEGLTPTTLHVLVRFGKWNEILQEPKPQDFRLVSRAVYHYARAIAHAALGRPDLARAEADAFEQAAAEIPEDWYVMNNKVDTILPIGRAMLAGEIAFREGRYEEAFSSLRQAVAMEDALIYDEPPGWMLPIRHSLGALLMSAGRFTEAEEVYREDLRRNRDNAWALLGLQQALTAQGRSDEARMLSQKLDNAWRRADVQPTASCMCEPQERWLSSVSQ